MERFKDERKKITKLPYVRAVVMNEVQDSVYISTNFSNGDTRKKLEEMGFSEQSGTVSGMYGSNLTWYHRDGAPPTPAS